ncbi:MAG: DNA-binding protein [Pseudomonadota bacterium]
MNIKPIKTKKDYETALKRIESLMSARKNTARGDELDVLTTLVEAYEQKRFQIDNPDPIAAIEHRMEALNIGRKDLAPILGSKSRVSEVLGRKRKLTMEMVRNLHKKMGIPAQTLIQDYELRPH